MSDTSLQWYKSLNMFQRFGLREAAVLICGMEWHQFNILFTPRERINILYDKLKSERII